MKWMCLRLCFTTVLLTLFAVGNAQIVFDSSFRGNGISYHAYYYGSFSYPAVSTKMFSHITGKNGKIYALGTGFSNTSGCLYRFKEDGTIDLPFGGNNTGASEFYNCDDQVLIHRLPGDTMLVFGRGWDNTGNHNTFNQQLTVLKVSPAGNFVSGFGNNGRKQFFEPAYGYLGGLPSAITVQSDGKILLGISVQSFFPPTSVVRLLPNGQLDSTFGHSGSFVLPFGSCGFQAAGIRQLPNGKIMIAGDYYSDHSSAHYGVCRLTANGAVDSTYGTNGVAYVAVDGQSKVASASMLADGKVLLTGSYGHVLQFNAQGVPDSTFGTNGLYTCTNWSTVHPSSIITDSNGRHYLYGKYATGSTPSNGPFSMFLLRLKPNGSIDSTFNGTGNFTYQVTGSGEPKSVELVGRDTVVMSGHVTDQNFFSQIFLAKVLIHPVLQVIGYSPSTYCAGDTAGLYAYTFGAVRWLRNGVLMSDTGSYIRVGQSGSYRAIATFAGTPDTSLAKELLFRTPVQPTISLSGNVLIASGSGAFYWYDSSRSLIPGAANRSFSPAISGTYYVSSLDSNGCRGMSTGFRYEVPPTSVSSVISIPGIKVFPNPFSDHLYVHNTNNQPAAITVYDFLGRIVFREVVDHGNDDLLQHFSTTSNNAFYFVKISCAGKSETIKVHYLKL